MRSKFMICSIIATSLVNLHASNALADEQPPQPLPVVQATAQPVSEDTRIAFCDALSESVQSLDLYSMTAQTSALDAANMSAESLAPDHKAVHGKSFTRITQDVTDSNVAYSKGMPLYGSLIALPLTQNFTPYQSKLVTVTAQFYQIILAAAHKMTSDAADLANLVKARNSDSRSAEGDAARGIGADDESSSTSGTASCYGNSCSFQSTTSQNTDGFWGALHRANTRRAAARAGQEAAAAQNEAQDVSSLRATVNQQIANSAQVPYLVPVLHAKWTAICPSMTFSSYVTNTAQP